ncbi:MAG: CDP-glycerol glycerophosphotransferase family protein [Micrococcales bacterium]|nr:CDP-glycerol glycerophosphotransferase family protein [Micrococcales bacterium]
MAVGSPRARQWAWFSSTAASLGLHTSLLDLVAVGTLVAAFFGAPVGLLVGLAAIVLGASVAAGRTMDETAVSTIRALRSVVTARVSVVVVGAWLAGRALVGTASTAVIVALLAGTAVLEPVIARLSSISGTVVSGIDSMPTHSGPWLPFDLAHWVNSVALALNLCWPFAPSWWSAVGVTAGAAAACVACISLLDASLGIRARHQQEKRLRKALWALRPKAAIYWVASAGTEFQLRMWLPHLERLGVPFFVIVRTRSNFEEARAMTSVPVVLCRFADDLDAVVVKSLKTVFYTNNSVRNMHMVRFPGLVHIQLNHGDSDKAPSFNPVFRMYDKNFVAGQAAIDRFAANGVPVRPEVFSIVGRPQVADVEVSDAVIDAIEHPTVLYAPTWYGFNADSRYSSLGLGPDLVRLLLAAGANVIFRPHPYSRRTPAFVSAINEIHALLKADSRPEARHVYGPAAETQWSITDCFNHADAMVSDVSSVVNDFLFSAKPMAIVAVSTPVAAFAAEFPIARAAYVLDASSGELRGADDEIQLMLGQDPLRETRQTLRPYYLGDFPVDGYADHFVREARRFIV